MMFPSTCGRKVALLACCAFVTSAPALADDQGETRIFALKQISIPAETSETGETPQASPVPEPHSPRRKGAEAARSPQDKGRESRRIAAAPVGSEGLKALVARHAAANGVPFALADAVVRVESRYNPRAASAGNYGLMQIRHQTARGVGYGGSASGLLDAETNARYGMKYLAQAYRLAGGDTCRTIMKYQSGHMSERMSRANRTYCAKVRTISASN